MTVENAEVDTPVLAIAKHWPDDAQDMIYAAYNERALQLEADEQAAKASFLDALASRGGN